MFYLEPGDKNFKMSRIRNIEMMLDFINEAALAARVKVVCENEDNSTSVTEIDVKINKTSSQIINTKVPIEHVMYALWKKGYRILNQNSIKKAFRSAYLIVEKDKK